MSADLGMVGAAHSKRRAYLTKGTLGAFFFLFLAAAWASTASGNVGYVTKLSNAYTFGNVSISPDGHLVSYLADDNRYYVKDLDNGNVTASIGLNYFSADNRFRAFSSDHSDLVPGDTNDAPDIFVEDAQNHVITRASTASGGAQPPSPCAGCGSQAPGISADGRYVVFSSYLDALVPGDTNSAQDIFVKDTLTDTTTRVSTAADGAQATPGCPDTSYLYCGSSYPAISANGRYVTFTSDATDLVPDDTNGVSDIFVKDMLTGATTRISTLPDGQQQTMGSCNHSWCGSYASAISADGHYVAFDSDASNLIPASGDSQMNVFVKDTLTGATTLASTNSDGDQLLASTPSISADGTIVTFILSNMQGIGIKNLTTGIMDRVFSSWEGTPQLAADGRHFVFGRYFEDYNQEVPGVGLYVGATSSCTDISGSELTLSKDRVYWPSYWHYANRIVGVDFNVTNQSADPAYSLIVTGFTTTDYAKLWQTLPVNTGVDIYPGGQGQFTLHFDTGPGTSHFMATLQAHSRNSCAVETVHPH